MRTSEDCDGEHHYAGRNDLCPCGSRKKYKKCCELKQRKTRGATMMMLLVGILMAAGVIAGITAMTSDRRDVGAAGWRLVSRTWSLSLI